MGPKRARFVGVGRLLANVRGQFDDDPTDVDVPFGEGAFQRLTLVAATLSSVAFLLHVDSFRLATRVMDHWCRRPADFASLSVSEWKSLAFPTEADGSPSQCTVRNPPYGGLKALIVTCQEWEFNLTGRGDNIVSEWSLVCQRQRLIDMAVLVYIAACAVWLPLAGFAADHVGRRVVIRVPFVALLAAGFCTSLANLLRLFVFLRVVVWLSAHSLMLLLCEVLYEVSTSSRRLVYCYLAPAVTLTVVPLILHAASHLEQGWRAFHLALMTPTTLLAAAFVVVDECPAWLVASRRRAEAAQAALKAARVNGFPEAECREWFKKADQRSGPRSSEIMANRNYISMFVEGSRTRSMLLCYIWGAATLSFGQLYVNDTFPLPQHVALTGMHCQVPMCATVYTCVLAFGVKRTAVVLAMMYSSMSWTVAALYDAKRTLTCAILVVTLRMVGTASGALLPLLTMQQYVPSLSWRAFVLTYALGKVGWSVSGMPYIYTHRYLRDITMAVVAILMAFVSVTLEHLPPTVDLQRRSRIERSRSSVSRCSSVAVAIDVRRSMQDSLVSLPKGPIKTRAKHVRQQDVMPQQHTLKISKMKNL
ncbi:hypothetical protein HPB48_023356 [Haemaphysalis longicornis]|uniref:Uncharacterized protein n=1 Tax=Haemaphysalis longicornis TaxID=44386 RepID=A0A9J6H6Y3_HAELO|nr:hypothetical protein HPB48_023356 [Haemaphysalis longicornis]